MATLLLVLVVVLVIAGLVFGVVTLISGDDPGLGAAEPDGRARPLPNDRSLHEDDLKEVRFDVALRGYRMAQVDRVLRRTAYDLGYKDEMIAVLEAEVAALREGRQADAEVLRKAREEAASPEPDEPRSPAQDAIDFGEVDDEPDFEPTPAFAQLAERTSEQREPAADGARTDRPAGADATEPREGSLLRRNPPPDTTRLEATVTDPGQTALEVADRPAHA